MGSRKKSCIQCGKAFELLEWEDTSYNFYLCDECGKPIIQKYGIERLTGQRIIEEYKRKC